MLMSVLNLTGIQLDVCTHNLTSARSLVFALNDVTMSSAPQDHLRQLRSRRRRKRVSMIIIETIVAFDFMLFYVSL